MTTNTRSKRRPPAVRVQWPRAVALALTLVFATACAERSARTTSPPAATATKDPQAAAAPTARKVLRADGVRRVPVAEAHRLAKSKAALLVCAYDNDAKFAKMALEGAISRSTFEAQRARTAKNKQLIFYCA